MGPRSQTILERLKALLRQAVLDVWYAGVKIGSRDDGPAVGQGRAGVLRTLSRLLVVGSLGLDAQAMAEAEIGYPGYP